MLGWITRWFEKEIAYADDRIAAADADKGWEATAYWANHNADLRARFALRKARLLFWRNLLGL